MSNIKKFENFEIINKSELGNNWSSDFYKNKKEGKFPYIKTKNMFVKIDTKKTIPVNAVYLTPIQVAEYNKISIQIEKLKEEQDKIL